MTNELYHYGVIGMKWGVRRYQNKDGTLTALGRKLARKIDKKDARRIRRGKEAYSEEEKTKKLTATAKVDRYYHISRLVTSGVLASGAAFAGLKAISNPLAAGPLLAAGKTAAELALVNLAFDAVDSNFYQK